MSGQPPPSFSVYTQQQQRPGPNPLLRANSVAMYPTGSNPPPNYAPATSAAPYQPQPLYTSPTPVYGAQPGVVPLGGGVSPTYRNSAAQVAAANMAAPISHTSQFNSSPSPASLMFSSNTTTPINNNRYSTPSLAMNNNNNNNTSMSNLNSMNNMSSMNNMNNNSMNTSMGAYQPSYIGNTSGGGGGGGSSIAGMGGGRERRSTISSSNYQPITSTPSLLQQQGGGGGGGRPGRPGSSRQSSDDQLFEQQLQNLRLGGALSGSTSTNNPYQSGGSTYQPPPSSAQFARPNNATTEAQRKFDEQQKLYQAQLKQKKLEEQRKIDEKRREEEMRRQQEEQRRREEEQRRQQEEQRRQQEELRRQQLLLEQQRQQEEQRRREEEQRRRQQEEQRQRQIMLAEQQRIQEEQRRIAEQQRIAETQRQAELQQQRLLEQKRIADQKRLLETQRQAELQQQRLLEEQRQQRLREEQQRLALQQQQEEQRRVQALLEQQRQQEALRLAEQQRQQQDALRMAEQQRLKAAEELRVRQEQLLLQQRQQEALRLAEQQRQQQDALRLEQQRLLEEQKAQKVAEELARAKREEEERIKKQIEDQVRQQTEQIEREKQAEFQQKWQEREAHYKLEEQKRQQKEEQQRNLAEGQARLKRMEAEQKRLEQERLQREQLEAQRQAELEAAAKRQAELEQRQAKEVVPPTRPLPAKPSSSATLPTPGSPGAPPTRANYDATAAWNITKEEIKIGELVGTGAFGAVYKGKLHGTQVAVKKLLVQQVEEHVLHEFQMEVAVMSQLRHPNILLFIGACMEPHHMAIVTEFMPLGSLQQVLFDTERHRRPLSMKQRLCILKEVALGMTYLHSLRPPFLHRDLKCGNVLLDHSLTVKIADFGLAAVKQLDAEGRPIQALVGSPFYMAPEVLLEQPYDTKADVYSFSIVAWETVTNTEPYQGDFESFEELVEGITVDEMRPTLPDWLPPGLVQLLQMCWNSDPDQRPSFSDIVQQGWFDHLLVDSFLAPTGGGGDPVACDFWKRAFLETLSVPTDEFLRALCQFAGATYKEDSPPVALIKQLVSSADPNGQPVVTIDNFTAHLVDWFAPFASPKDLLEVPLQKAAVAWFHGAVAVEHVEPFLLTQPAGSWLIRQGSVLPASAECPHPLREYFLTFVDNNKKISHVPIRQVPASGVLLFANKQFSSWPELFKELASQFSINLSAPCIGSPFLRFATK